ncbi:MAG: ATP-binding protein [Coriobacteriales bacterium]|nr:ATP-binding protein [Coriobacteriales bacterium]
MRQPEHTLTPSGYVHRLVESRLDTLMHGFGCVEITGPKWCGKTWTALSRCASVTHLDKRSDREAALVDPDLALVGDAPHLVDEWQEVPEVWDATRRFIDNSGNKRGLFLLTGSTNLKKEDREKVHHSGTGRIAHIVMRPMCLAETGDSSAGISFKDLLEGTALTPMKSNAEIYDIARWCCRGGWPANLGLKDNIALETANQYVQSVVNINVVDEGYSPETALSLMRALAINASQAVTYKTLSQDMGRGNNGIDPGTIVSYLDFFERLYLTESLYGWEPPMRSKARVRVKPKRYFVDPSLAAALLFATPTRLVHDMQTLGLLFENLVIRDLRVFLSTYSGIGNSIYYYRDEKGLEVDAIVEYAGRWAGIEIKLSDTKADEAAANLIRLRNKVLNNAAHQNNEPAFLAVIVGKGSMAYQRQDGVLIVPASLLGA